MKNNQPLLETIKIFVIKSLWILNNPYIGTFYAIINSGNWTERRSAIWSEIIRMISKSQVWFQTKIALHEVQLPLYYIHFEITHFFESVLVHTAGL